MLEMLKKELEERGAFKEPLPSFILDLSKSIHSKRIPEKMKITIAVSELILFVSEFRRNILHWNNSLIPINAITFVICHSGSGKDSSVNAMRRNFTKGYALINEERKRLAVKRAIAEAESKKLAKASIPEVYLKFYKEPMPLFTAPSTNEGFIKYLNELDDDGIGAGYVYAGEIGGELATSSTIIANFQLLSELYDEGKKEVKVLKSEENQSREIKNLPVSALLVGSPDNILLDEQIKKKFKLEFTSKLARRSFFNFNPESIEDNDYKSIEEFLSQEREREDYAREINKNYNALSLAVAELQLKKRSIPIIISDEARLLMTLYQKYNQEMSELVKRQYPISKLVRAHLHWKAFKLAGAIAIIKEHEAITEQDYKEAITFTEMLSKDMEAFEIELVKEPYELFTTLVNQHLEDNKCFINIHTLKKLGYIQGNSNITSKIKELATLAGSYDESGMYKATENGIEYSKIIKTNASGVSFKVCEGTKVQRAKDSSSGFEYTEVDFEFLGDMLKKDYAYSPFRFKNGIRSKVNVVGGCKWIALDIDNSLFTDEQMHIILGGFNHHIVRTSNKSEAKKFRLLLELDSYIDLDDTVYKYFIESIGEYLSLDIDVLPKCQIYFSYSDRDVLSVTDKEPLSVREHLINAYEREDKPKVNLNKYTDAQKQALLENPFDTFHYAFNAKHGEGSFSLIRAAKHARDLGMDKDDILTLIEDINAYWESPMETERLENTILSQIRRW